MKTVVNNAMVRHLWANQSQSHARSNNGNLSFDGPTLFSYVTPIARIVKGAAGQDVALITTDTYSVTTSGKHMPRHSDVAHIPHFHVPFIMDILDRPTDDRAAIIADRHRWNMEYMVAKMNELFGSATRAINEKMWLSREYVFDKDDLSYRSPQSIGRMIVAYAAAFGLELPTNLPDVGGEIEKIRRFRAEREARNNTPAKIAERQRRAELKEEEARRQEERFAADAAQRVEKWKAGENVYAYRATPAGGAYLRVKGDRIETSMGASVPLKDGLRLARFCALAKEGGIEVEYQGNGPVVGSFRLSSIDRKGNARVGCHLLEWTEIEDCAKRAGITIDTTPGKGE